MAAVLLPLLIAAVTIECQCAAAHGRSGLTSRRDGLRLQFRREAARSQVERAAELYVGTEPGKSNVVSNFEVVGTWQSGDDMASSVEQSQTATKFYIRATGGNLQLSKASVDPAEVPHMRPYLEGEVAKKLEEQGKVDFRPDQEQQLTLSYDCRFVGETKLTLTLEFEGLSALPIPITKKCGGEQNKALTVSTSNGDKVVTMGNVLWDELKVVGVRQTSETFSLLVDSLSEQGSQDISAPKATGIGACGARVRPESVKKLSKGKTTLAAGESTTFVLDYRCFRHGKCIVTTQVPFFPDMAPYAPLRWTWTKLCGGDALGLNVQIPEAGMRYVATDGAPNTSATQWIAGTDLDKHTVRLINDEARSLESDIKITSLAVRCLDSQRCTSRISEVPKVLRAAAPLSLQVDYTCHTSGSSIVQLSLSTEGHDPVITTWAKDCEAFADSYIGFLLISTCSCLCFGCACVGCFRMFFESSGSARERPILEGEFIEDENLTQDEITALNHYEQFYGLQKGAASIEQVRDSVLGVSGWAAKDSERPSV